MTRILNEQDYPASASYLRRIDIDVATDRFFSHFQLGNANNSVAIERITIRLAQNSAQCNYWQICGNGFSNCANFRQLLDFCSIVTQCHAWITWCSEGWKPILTVGHLGQETIGDRLIQETRSWQNPKESPRHDSMEVSHCRWGTVSAAKLKPPQILYTDIQSTTVHTWRTCGQLQERTFIDNIPFRFLLLRYYRNAFHSTRTIRYCKHRYLHWRGWQHNHGYSTVS